MFGNFNMVTKINLQTAKERLEAYRLENGAGPHRAAILADVIWPTGKWRSQQGAGAAATRVLKTLGCHWISTRDNWGWILGFPNTETSKRGT